MWWKRVRIVFSITFFIHHRSQVRLSTPLQKYRVLIADADQQLSLVLKLMLGQMGFTDVQLTRSGQQALDYLNKESFDFLITEWNTQHLDGLGVISHIRHEGITSNPTLPIIMLTGRAEESDVETARDQGINEYVVKPFSANTIFSRLERIIEHPRNFVVSNGFIGPDRRHKIKLPDGFVDRRAEKTLPKPQPKSTAKALQTPGPKLWLPDKTLQNKLGKDVTLRSIITPQILEKAQLSINAATNESLAWVKDNLTDLKARFQRILDGKKNQDAAKELGEIALVINSRAGTFGHSRASEVAYMLYLFCRKHFDATQIIHHTIVQKHIEVLQLILSGDIQGMSSATGALIVKELRELVGKYVK